MAACLEKPKIAEIIKTPESGRTSTKIGRCWPNFGQQLAGADQKLADIGPIWPMWAKLGLALPSSARLGRIWSSVGPISPTLVKSGPKLANVGHALSKFNTNMAKLGRALRKKFGQDWPNFGTIRPMVIELGSQSNFSKSVYQLLGN